MNNPEFVKINDKKYKINTDFRVAIECNRIAMDSTIGDYERALAIIYTLYGENGLNDIENHEELIRLGMKYLSCGKEVDNTSKKSDMDFIQDMDYIEASFMSDYHIDLPNEPMHWWKFMNLINGLSNSEIGNCCILNRIRNLRNFDLSQVKDSKERTKIAKAKKMVELDSKEIVLTNEQKHNNEEFNKILEKWR